MRDLELRAKRRYTNFVNQQIEQAQEKGYVDGYMEALNDVENITKDFNQSDRSIVELLRALEELKK